MQLSIKHLFIYTAIIISGGIYIAVVMTIFLGGTFSVKKPVLPVMVLYTPVPTSVCIFPLPIPLSSFHSFTYKQSTTTQSHQTSIKNNSSTSKTNSSITHVTLYKKTSLPVKIIPSPKMLPLAASSIRGALVNIFCKMKSSNSTEQYISGSGVFVSPNGYILTNAHVAQYFLLRNYPLTNATKCTVRTGNPAHNRYNATVVFISSAWVKTNATTSAQMTPHGTGEHDIAVLAVTRSDTSVTLPVSFPFVSIATTTPFVGDNVVIGSYAAQFLSNGIVQTALYPTIVYGSVKKLYTFATTTIDVVGLGGTVAAQEGSSGGGIVNAYNKLIALITTSTITGPTNKRNLTAITSSYIRRDYLRESGQSLNALLSESTTTAIKSFAPIKQKLTTYIIQALSSQ